MCERGKLEMKVPILVQSGVRYLSSPLGISETPWSIITKRVDSRNHGLQTQFQFTVKNLQRGLKAVVDEHEERMQSRHRKKPREVLGKPAGACGTAKVLDEQRT